MVATAGAHLNGRLDAQAVKQQVDLLALIGRDTALKKVSAARGGEYAGPCPFCGGTDRFRVQPAQGQWWCRKCSSDEHWQDAIAYLMRRDGLTFPEALAAFAGEPTPAATPARATAPRPKPAHTPPSTPERKRPQGTPEETYPYYDIDGQLLAYHWRYRRPGTDRHGKPNKTFTWITADGYVSAGDVKTTELPPYNLPGLALLPDAPVWGVEGERAADAAVEAGLCAVSVPGGAGQRDFSAVVPHLKGRLVHLWADNDDAGRELVEHLATALRGVAAEVRIVTVPDLPDAGDAADYFAAGRTVEELEACVTAAPAQPPPPPSAALGVPKIDAAVQDLRIITGQSWDALKQANDKEARLFRHGGLPVRIEPDDDTKPVLRELTPDRVRHELARAAEFYVDLKNGAKIVHPPKTVVLDMLATPNPPLPVVNRLTECPTFARDGALQTAAGYHAGSKTYCMEQIAGLQPVPAVPTDADVQRSVTLYLELMQDFSFVSDADRANALALGLLVPARDLIAGPSPLHGIEAPTPGSGKGLLVEALLHPFCGTSYGQFTEGKDDDEWGKRLTSMLLNGFPAVLIDNVQRTLDSGALASTLTQLTRSDRLLGTNTTVHLPIRTVWLMTANNPTFSTEMARRTVPIRIDPKIDRPWTRSDFKHKELMEWVRKRRADLVWAGLVLIQNWIAKKRPPYKGAVLGSFEDWSRVMGGILQAAGIEGFLGNVGRFYDTVDMEGATWRGFTTAWWKAHQGSIVGTAELFAIALVTDGIDLGTGQERSQRTKFGKALSKQRDRVVGRYRITEAGTFRNAAMWQLVDTRPGDPPDADHDSPSNSPPANVHTDVHIPTPPPPADSLPPHVNIDGDVHTTPQIEPTPSVNVGERFCTQPYTREERVSPKDPAYSRGAQNVHDVHNVHTSTPRFHAGAWVYYDSPEGLQGPFQVRSVLWSDLVTSQWDTARDGAWPGGLWWYGVTDPQTTGSLPESRLEPAETPEEAEVF